MVAIVGGAHTCPCCGYTDTTVTVTYSNRDTGSTAWVGGNYLTPEERELRAKQRARAEQLAELRRKRPRPPKLPPEQVRRLDACDRRSKAKRYGRLRYPVGFL